MEARSGDAPVGERLPQRPLCGPRVERGERRLAAQEHRFLARFRTLRHDVAVHRVGDVGGHGKIHLVSRLRLHEPDRRAVPAYAAARQGDDVRRADAHPQPQLQHRLVAQGHATAICEDALELVLLVRGERHNRRLPRRRRVRQGEEQVGVRQLAPASEPLEELAYTRVERVLALGGRVRIPRVEELDVLGRDVGEVRDADAVDEHAEAANTRPEHVERRPLPALRPLHREERADLGRAPSRQPVEERFPGDDGPAEIVRDALVALPRGYHGPAAAREVAARRRAPSTPATRGRPAGRRADRWRPWTGTASCRGGRPRGWRFASGRARGARPPGRRRGRGRPRARCPRRRRLGRREGPRRSPGRRGPGNGPSSAPWRRPSARARA